MRIFTPAHAYQHGIAFFYHVEVSNSFANGANQAISKLNEVI
jgi:hypothetical protein